MWVESNSSAGLASAAQHGETLLNVPTRPELIRATITRTLLTVVFVIDSETAGDSARLDFGIAIVDSDAVAANALPDPGTPDSGMWLFRDMDIISAISGARDPRAHVRVKVDLGSQRILRQSQVVQLITDNASVVGVPAITQFVMSRILVKLP